MESHEPSAASSGGTPSRPTWRGKRRRAEDAVVPPPINQPTIDPAATAPAAKKSGGASRPLPRTKVLGNRSRVEDAIVLPRGPFTAADVVEKGVVNVPQVRPSRLSERAAVIIAVILSAGVLLFLLAQTANLLQATHQSLTLPLHYVAVVLVLILWGLLTYGAVALIRPVWRLSRSHPIARAELVDMTSADMTSADITPADKVKCEQTCQRFRRFLTAIKSPEHKALLVTCGWTERRTDGTSEAPSLADFREALDELGHPGQRAIAEWLQEVDQRILSPLDQAAKTLIARRATAAAVSTAISPKGLFDSLIVLGSCFALTSQLCRLYGLRPSGPATALLVLHSMFNTLVAGGAGNATSIIEEYGQAIGEDFVGATAAAVLSKVASRVAEGGVNRHLIHRFGRRVQAAIRPIEAAA